MQNEANFKNAKNNLSLYMPNAYTKIRLLAKSENKAKTNPNEPNFTPIFDTASKKQTQLVAYAIKPNF